MENETSLNVCEHYDYLSFLLSMHAKDISNVVVVPGDNCSAERLISEQIGPTLLSVTVTASIYQSHH